MNALDTKHMIEHLDNILRPSTTRVKPDMKQPSPTLNKCPYPMNNENNDCDASYPYRTLDGSCNNIQRPMWGKSFRGFARFLFPNYYDGNNTCIYMYIHIHTHTHIYIYI